MGGISPAQSRRKTIAGELPDLGKLTIERGRSEAKAALVLKLLRQTATECQTVCSLPFYPVRAVAAHFGVSPATVSRIYHRLYSERLLRLVWGSKTMVEPLESAERVQPRTIGIPVGLFRFTSALDYREAILNLQREIWNYRITEHLLFFEHHDEEVLDLYKRYHFSALDLVLWLFPDVSNTETLLRLCNLGIRVICIGDTAISGIRDCYTISDRCMISKILREKILKI
jgi:hypothetical protein